MTELYVHFKWVNFKECEFFLKKKKRKKKNDFSILSSKGVYPCLFVGVYTDGKRRNWRLGTASRKLLQGMCLFIVIPPLPTAKDGNKDWRCWGQSMALGKSWVRTGWNSLRRGPGGRRWSQHKITLSRSSSLETPQDMASHQQRA